MHDVIDAKNLTDYHSNILIMQSTFFCTDLANHRHGTRGAGSTISPPPPTFLKLPWKLLYEVVRNY